MIFFSQSAKVVTQFSDYHAKFFHISAVVLHWQFVVVVLIIVRCNWHDNFGKHLAQ